jgi:hypothetical protein
MMNRKLIAPIAAAIALSLWGCGPDADRNARNQSSAVPPVDQPAPPRIAQSPDATGTPRTPNERSGDSAPSPSRGMEERPVPGSGSPATPGAMPGNPDNRSLNQGMKDQPNAQPIPGNPSADKDKNSKNND